MAEFGDEAEAPSAFVRGVARSAGAVFEAVQALGFVASAPGVETLAADAVVATGGGDVAVRLFRVTQRGEPNS